MEAQGHMKYQLTRIGYQDGFGVFDQFLSVSFDFIRFLGQCFKSWVIFSSFGLAKAFLGELLGSVENGSRFITNMRILSRFQKEKG